MPMNAFQFSRSTMNTGHRNAGLLATTVTRALMVNMVSVVSNPRTVIMARIRLAAIRILWQFGFCNRSFDFCFSRAHLGPLVVIPCLALHLTFPTTRIRNFESSPSQAEKAAEAWIIRACLSLPLLVFRFCMSCSEDVRREVGSKHICLHSMACTSTSTCALPRMRLRMWLFPHRCESPGCMNEFEHSTFAFLGGDLCCSGLDHPGGLSGQLA